MERFNFSNIVYILKRYFILIISILIVVITIIGSGVYLYVNKCPKCEVCSEIESNIDSNIDLSESKNFIQVDVKGAVKKSGVYSLENGAIVEDAINLAGGITSKGTTKNINLSKKLTDEMVIYVYTKKELENELINNEIPCECETITINECLEEENSSVTETGSKVSINTANIDELKTLNGIGDAKAKAIIEYRESNGLFKSIEDIKNVSGIGDSAFEKIKDYITT